MNPEYASSLRYVRLTKIAPVNQPLALPGSVGDYPYGSVCLTHSLPLGYWLEGWLLHPPQIGECLRVFRIVRNGASCLGFFASTEVTEIRSQGEFCTMNSIYRYEEIQSNAGPQLDELPVEARDQFREWIKAQEG